jgi:HAD superfamily hydrolase (TIGR01490 family)
MPDYCAGRLDQEAYVEFATSGWRLRGRGEAEALRDRFMTERLVPSIQPQALQLVRRHQSRGDLVALVTATNEFVTAPIAEAFGIEHLIAVRLQRDVGGWFTGRIDGIPSFREGKIARVEEWLLQLGHRRDDFASVACYSDSPNDLPLLEWADEAVATNPSEGAGRGGRRAGLAGAEAIPMIKKFIKNLFGTKPAAAAPKSVLGTRVEVPVAEHGIDPKLLDDRAVRVVETLQQAGYEAYVVGGAVRDLLLGPPAQGLRRCHQRHARAGQEPVPARFHHRPALPHRACGAWARTRPRGDRGVDLPGPAR